MPHRLRTWVATTALLAAFAGLVVSEYLERTPWRFAEIRGTGWRAIGEDGAPLVAPRDTAAVLLNPGQSIVFDFEERDERALSKLAFTVERLGDFSFLELRARETDDGAYELRLGPHASIGVSLGMVATDRPRRRLFDDRSTSWVPARSTKFRVEWSTGNDRLGLAIDTKPVFDIVDLRQREGAISLTARGAPIRFHDIALDRRDGGREVEFVGATTEFPSVGYVRPVGVAIGKWVFALLAVALGVISAFQRRFTIVDLAKSIGLGAIPAAAWFATSIVLGSLPGPVGYCVSLAIGFAIVSIRLSRHDPAAVAPLRPSLLVAACMLVSAAIAMLSVEREFALHRSLADEIRYAEAQPTPSPFRAANLVELDIANSFAVRQRDRNLDLSMVANLASQSLLEVRLHADRSNAVALFLSSDPKHRTRFVRESETEFTRIGDDSEAIPSSEPHRVRIEVRGEDYRAYVDGRLVAEASERRFPAGETMLLAARGSAKIDEFSIEPVAGKRPETRVWGDIGRALVNSIVLGLAYAVIAGSLLRRSIAATFVFATCAMIPAFVAMVDAGASSVARGATIATTILFFALATIHAVIAIPGTTAPRFQAALFVALAASAALYQQLDRRFGAPTFEEINRLSVLEFDGKRIDPSVLDLEHPLLRRWNFYLRDHEFRDRGFRLAKRPGQLRVIGLGTSSTYGYGGDADWPTLLERELKTSDHGIGDVDVINAGCSGSAGSRLIYFFENTLVHFRPDVLVLSLFHNDSIVMTQFDESAVLREIVSDDGLSWSESFRFRRTMNAGMKRPSALNLAWNAGKFDPARDWDVPGLASPIERFESVMREFVRIAREHEIRLVFLQEPLAGDQRLMWKDEFRAVIRSVAGEIGAPVVDPTAAQLENGGANLFVDHIHPNAAGHRVTAKVLAPVVAEVLRSLK